MVTSRIWFTAAQKAELWERWKNGQSAAAISRALERKNKTGVERIVVLHGGIGPAPRRRALAALRFEEREEISRGISVGRSIRQIAQGLRRAPSTVSREIRRNGGSQAYRANRADRRARERALRPKPCRLALYSALRWRVAQKLALQWSPQQISGWLKQEFPTHQDMQISHEAIYRSLFIQTRGVLKKELSAQLRTARRMRHPKSHNAKSGQGHIPPSPTLGGRIHIPPPMTLRRSVPASGLAGMRVFGWPRGSAPGVPACCFCAAPAGPADQRCASHRCFCAATSSFAQVRQPLSPVPGCCPSRYSASSAASSPVFHLDRVDLKWTADAGSSLNSVGSYLR